jgi:hypothetical protein
MQDQARTITLDGISYDVGQFSQGVQNAIGIYNGFSADLQKEQMAVMKSQAAMQTVGAQIAEAVKAELAAKTEEVSKMNENAADDAVPASNGEDK